MDVYSPERPNGLAVIVFNGSGFHVPLSYDAVPLKERGATRTHGTPLVEAGYTVFVPNHRAAPAFRYPAAVEDAKRAVRYVRAGAERFGVDSARIGVMGYSSGAYLASMLGVLREEGDPEAPDPVEQVSAAVQCVVARAAPVDFVEHTSAAEANFLGMLPAPGGRPVPPGSIEHRTYREASVIYQVKRGAPPFLLIHGDADPVVSFRNSERMQTCARGCGDSSSSVAGRRWRPSSGLPGSREPS